MCWKKRKARFRKTSPENSGRLHGESKPKTFKREKPERESPKLVEYEDCIAIEFSEENPEERYIEVIFRGFWQREETILVGLVGNKVTSICLPKEISEEELGEICLLRWTVHPKDQPPWDEYVSFDLDRKRILCARYPSTENLRKSRLNLDLLPSFVLPSSWLIVDQMIVPLNLLPNISAVDVNYYVYDEWKRRFASFVKTEEMEKEFTRFLRFQREVPALLRALGYRVQMRRCDVVRGMRILASKKRYKRLTEKDILGSDEAWSEISGNFDLIENPIILFKEHERCSTQPATGLLTFHSSEYLHEDDASIEYVLLSLFDDENSPIATYEMWLPPLGEPRDLEALFYNRLENDNMIPKQIMVINKPQPVRICGGCGNLLAEDFSDCEVVRRNKEIAYEEYIN